MEQYEKENALILALCEEVGPEHNADGTSTAGWTDEQRIEGFRSNHSSPELIREAAEGDVTALISLRSACGLRIFT